MSKFQCLGLLAATAIFPLLGQQPAPEAVKFGDWTLTGSLRSRVENWQWFTPNTGDPGYTFMGNNLRLGIGTTGKPVDFLFEFESPVLLNLPNNAVATGVQGQLGLGAGYYVANKKSRNIAGFFPKQIFAKFNNMFGDSASSLKVGRFEFQDGSEVTATNAAIGVIKRDRVHQRLIGPFVFTHVMRSFDGIHYVYNKPKINYTFIGALPTRGVFQVDGWGWMQTAFAYASATGQVSPGNASTGEWRAFGIYYDDWRQVLKADNRTVPVRTADHGNIKIYTYGGHYVHAAETRVGTFDFLGLGALQFGKWGSLDQRSGMVDIEGGWQPKFLPGLKPWFRVGYYYGSGDGNPNDNRHTTFFQILPTARPFARFPFFDMMNNNDRFAMATIRPHKKVTLKTELHALRLAEHNDLWYQGGGAYQPWSFGYQARSGAGARGLANLFDGSADINVNAHLSMTLYYGYAVGKSVIEAIYPKGANGHLGYTEFTYRF